MAKMRDGSDYRWFEVAIKAELPVARQLRTGYTVGEVVYMRAVPRDDGTPPTRWMVFDGNVRRGAQFVDRETARRCLVPVLKGGSPKPAAQQAFLCDAYRASLYQ